MFERLRALDLSCGPQSNKHDRVIVLITACIAEGQNSRAQILGILGHLNFHRGHVAIQLERGTGNDPARFRWRRDRDGHYSLLS